MTEITNAMIDSLRNSIQDTPNFDVLRRSVVKNGVLATSQDDETVNRLTRTFSIEVETGKVSNQLHSGRCWIYALMNTLRHTAAKKLNLKDFELSQSYMYFWDKIERANMFYEHILNTTDRPETDRELKFYLSTPGADGGQWAMAAGLVQKYGVVPATVMPETFNTKDTSGFRDALNLKLRRDALQLRKMQASGASSSELQSERTSLLKEVYKMTVMAVGEPPVAFDFEYKDDDKKYHLDQSITPQEFYDKYIGVDLDQYVVVTNSPDKELNKLYSLPAEDNIVNGKPITFLNVEMNVLRQTAIQQLKDGETVWFGNDVVKQMDRKAGLLDSELYKREELFGVDLDMSKANRLRYGEATVSHAMTLTGVDIVNDQATKWKVENSWGDQNGAQGYFVMGDNWFEDFVYEVVVQRKYLNEAQKQLADSTPTPLTAWDPLM